MPKLTRSLILPLLLSLLPAVQVLPARAITLAGASGANKAEGFTIVPPWKEGSQATITSTYSPSGGSTFHDNNSSGSKDYYALDFVFPAGEPAVHPVAPGVVAFAGRATNGYSSYGCIVFIRHENDYQSFYAHLAFAPGTTDCRLPVVSGQFVDTSTVIGNVGNSGIGGTVHLHFALYRGATLRTSPSVGPADGTAIVPEPFAACNRAGSPQCEDLNGGGLTLQKERSAPAALKDALGRIYLFARDGQNRLRYTIQRNSTTNAWDPWRTLDDTRTWTQAPALAVDGQSRLHVFMRGSDNALWFNVLTGTSPAGEPIWSGWRSLGGYVVGNPVVAFNRIDSAGGTGRLEVFVRGADWALYRTWQVSADGWANWQYLGGILSDDPAAGQHLDGRAQAFVRLTDYQVYSLRPQTNGSWVPQSYTNWPPVVYAVGKIAAVKSASGELGVLFRRDFDLSVFNDADALWHIRPTNDGLNTAWTPLGTLAANPIAALNLDNKLQAFTRTINQNLSSEMESAPGSWPIPTSLDPLGFTAVITSDLTAVRAADNRLHVFAWEGNAVYQYLQPAPNSAAAWTRQSRGTL